MTAALVVTKETATPVAVIVSVANVSALGAAVRNANVDEANNTDVGRQQNNDLRYDSP